MTEAPSSVDGLDELYAAKLWSLIPEVYRTQDPLIIDATSLDSVGPLQELLTRIAVQVAAVRRSIDRLWEDQSIETCDSWVIPYLAELLDTNLVPSMGTREQRLDVANTIYYRRRKGTVALLEQLAADVTHYEAHVVEFFRGLGRTRHGLDPEIGLPSQATDPAEARRLQRAERLVGLLTGTPAGGYADLRNRLGAAATGTAYDEYHHRLDVRHAAGALGWYGISKLGFFLWRVVSVGVDRATPVKVKGCPAGHYSFDPTGRQIPLFQADDRGPNDYGENWTPLAAWQLPAPLTDQTWAAVAAVGQPVSWAYPDPDASVWPKSLSVSPIGADALTLEQVSVWPEVGRFAVRSGPATVEVGYHYGLFSQIGAGPFNRRRPGVPPPEYPAPAIVDDGAGLDPLATALSEVGATGTVVIADGLTRTTLAPVGTATAPITAVVVCADDEKRAVVRTEARADPWVFHGAVTDDQVPSRLRLEGILLSGTDIVLRGTFAEVEFSCCTIDPGTAGDQRDPVTVWDDAVDGRALTPSRIWVEGTVRSLVLDRCITGPVRTRRGGFIEVLTASDSILQGLPTALDSTLTEESVFDDDALFQALKYHHDPLSASLAKRLGVPASTAIADHVDHTPVTAGLADVITDLKAVIDGPLIWTDALYQDRPLRTSTQAAVAAPPPPGPDLVRLNRQLLAEAYPLALADATVATDEGLVELSRCTVLGAGYVHRLTCSESILDDVVRVINAQDGCVRFSAWSTDSALPRRYESVQVAAGAATFLSRRFGEWGYAIVDDGADNTIVSASTAGAPSILTGSHDGSEMGVYCRDGAAIKDRSLQIKLREYMPVGLAAVLLHMPAPDPDGERTRGRPWPTT